MAEPDGKAQQELSSIRDTVESIWVAIVLAFVLRAFVVEAFVIPTGSMAPRLLGEHLDLHCPACGFEYAFGWASEQGRQGEAAGPGRLARRSDQVPRGARCPNCGFDEPAPGPEAGGDRVLVMKYLYRFRPPEPWDVVVFKNPQDNRQNYIKRLIGLPGETIEIVHGDVFVKEREGGEFRIRRKDRPTVQEAMWQIVFDHDYLPGREVFDARNAKPPWPGASGPGPMTSATGSREVFDGRDAEARQSGSEKLVIPRWEPQEGGAWDRATLQTRRFAFTGGPPDREDELAFQADKEAFLPRYGYNSPAVEIDRRVEIDRSVEIVSDLKLAVTYIPRAADSRLVLSFSSFEYVFRGEISADGRARLMYRELLGTAWMKLADDVALASLEIGRGHEAALTHADLRVALWVDGRQVLVSHDSQEAPAGADTAAYPVDYAWMKERVRQARDDRRPRAIPPPQVRIAAAGGPCELRHVKLLRDVYYTSPSFHDGAPLGPVGNLAREVGLRGGQLGWGVNDNPIKLRSFPDRPDLDQFFVLGDNSPNSSDGRLWSQAAPTLRLKDERGRWVYKLGTVPRYSLIGKAVFVYWPAGFPLPALERLPILPNVGKMRLIR